MTRQFGCTFSINNQKYVIFFFIKKYKTLKTISFRYENIENKHQDVFSTVWSGILTFVLLNSMNYFFLELYRIRLRKCDFLVKLDLSVSRGNHIYYSTWAFSSTLFEFLLVSPVCKSVAMHLKVNTSPWLCLPFDSLLRVNQCHGEWWRTTESFLVFVVFSAVLCYLP